MAELDYSLFDVTFDFLACFDQVMVTVWKREAEKAEVQELGYLSVLQQCEPTHTFRHDLNTFKAQGTTHTHVQKNCALNGLMFV